MKDSDQQIIALLNQIKALSGGGGGVAWGAITGTLSAQGDLDTALGTKQTAAQVQALIDARITPKLISSTLLSTNDGSDQAVYTVGTGRQLVVTGITLRSASADLSAMSDSAKLKIGSNDWGPFFSSNELQTLISAARACGLVQSQSGNLGFWIGQDGDVISFTFRDSAITATATLDVFGYFLNNSGVPIQ